MDALTLRGDEGRGLAAISFGEVPSNFWSEDFRMGKPCRVNLCNSRANARESAPREVKHLSTWRSRKQCPQGRYFLSSGERKGNSPNRMHHTWCDAEVWRTNHEACSKKSQSDFFPIIHNSRFMILHRARRDAPGVVRQQCSLLEESKNMLLAEVAGKQRHRGW